MTCNFYCLAYFSIFETTYFYNLCWTHILVIILLRDGGPKMGPHPPSLTFFLLTLAKELKINH